MLASKGNPLIAGTPLDQMGTTIKVRALRPFYYGGRLQATGAVIEMPAHYALEACHLHRAEIFKEPPPPPPEIQSTPVAELLAQEAEPRRRGRPRKDETS